MALRITERFLNPKVLPSLGQAISNLAKNKIPIKYRARFLNIQSETGLKNTIDGINSNRRKPLDYNNIAESIRMLGSDAGIIGLRSWKRNEISISRQNPPEERWSIELYIVHHNFFLETVDNKRNYYLAIWSKFQAFASCAQTQQEKRLMAITFFHILRIHDKGTAKHMEETRKWAVAIAQQMGLSKKEISDIELAAFIHDIGKVAIDPEILNRQGLLTDDEIENDIHKHPQLGREFANNCGLGKEIADIIFFHHYLKKYPVCPEISDGTPPLGAKILTIADSFAAMTGREIYKPNKSWGEAIQELRAPRFGYDQEIVNFLERIVKELEGELAGNAKAIYRSNGIFIPKYMEARLQKLLSD